MSEQLAFGNRYGVSSRMPMSLLIDLDSARELLREAVSDWEEMLEELESSGGRLKFRPELSATISNLKIDVYPLLYERPEAAGVLLMQALMEPDEPTSGASTPMPSRSKTRACWWICRKTKPRYWRLSGQRIGESSNAAPFGP